MTRIERATSGAVPALVPLVAEYWAFEGITGFDSKRIAVQLERLLSEPKLGAGWIAIEEGRIVGYLLAVYVFSLEHSGLTAEIDELFVAPSQRGKGIGAELLTIAESEFAMRGCTNVSLQMSPNNDSARTFYHRHGYAEPSGYELLDKKLPDG